MSDKKQERGGQDTARPEQDATASQPNQTALPAEVVDSLEKTLETPQVQAEPTAAGATGLVAPPPAEQDAAPAHGPGPEPQAPPASEEPTAESQALSATELVQPTAVMPQVPLVAEAPAAEVIEPVAPQSDAPSADTVPTPTVVAASDPEIAATDDDTSDFTLSDITFSDAGPGGVGAWIQGLKTRLTIRRAAAAPSSESPAVKTKQRRLRPWQWAAIGVGTLVFLFVVFVAADSIVYYAKVHHGIKVDGQNLSRMTSAEATETLTSLAAEAQSEAITLTSDDRSWTVLPSDLDAVIDVPAVISEAMGSTRDGNVIVDLGNKIALYFKDRHLPLQGTLDNDKMDMLLGTIAGTLDVPAINATLQVVDGRIEVVEGTEGKIVDKEALRAGLTGLLFSFHNTELPIPMVVTSPDLSAMDVEDALAEANVMISADLALTYDGETIATITPEKLVTYLDVKPGTGDGGAKTVPVLSAEKMAALLDTVAPQVGTLPVDATFTMDLDAPEPYPLVIVEGRNGEGLDREATAAALTQAAMGTSARTAEVVLKTTEPERTTADLEALGIKDLLGDYKTSPYVGTKNRQLNVRLATSLCSGVFLAPGEEFNTDERLGLRNDNNGWAKAPGIVGPGQLEDVYGGGICQVSTTLFNAVLLSGLEITERHNHSIFINHYPDGRDATVTAGGKNMRFRNDTDHYVFIYGWSTGVNTRFWIWGVNDGRQVQPIKFSGFSYGAQYTTETYTNNSLPVGATEEIFSGQRARKCSIERTIIYADGTTKTESFSSYYPMMPKVIEINPAPVTTSPPPSPSTTAAPPPST